MRYAKQILLYTLVASSLLSFAQENPSELNEKVISYVKSVVGKKVKRGECWDLASEALNKVNAKWDDAYRFGRVVNEKKDSIYPGDFIQFENVELKYEKDGLQFKESMAHHTAIVYKVIAKGEYQLAHQNTGQHGRKVGLTDFKMINMSKGKAIFYRPEAK